MLDDISQAVLSRDEVVRYLQGVHGENSAEARERVYAYLDELHTTQRYTLYRALQHPLYPILRKIQRQVENVDRAVAATAAGRVIYASNHKSHTDYILEPLALDDHGVRPPIIAAGINLFGGPLGLLHRHVTGAIPIRRATKDPAYLITLKAYVGELLRSHDLLFYIEGGRSYSGELKSPKTGLIHAAMQAGMEDLVLVPVAISYDLVLEDRILARQGVKRRQRPFTRELAEMLRYLAGYRSRAFTTFGEPICTSEYNATSRRDVLDLAHRTREAIGLLYKVTPTALVAAAMRPSIERRDLEARIDALLDRLRERKANLAVESGREAVAFAIRPFERRGVLVVEGGRFRVRDRMLLRYYARTIGHLIVPARVRTPSDPNPAPPVIP
jgi:glycerol-3-phosphate O-acyltransferase